MKKILINLPKSNRIYKIFKSKFPHAFFYGRTSLGSGRNSYLITEKEYDENKAWFKIKSITKAKEQPNFF